MPLFYQLILHYLLKRHRRSKYFRARYIRAATRENKTNLPLATNRRYSRSSTHHETVGMILLQPESPTFGNAVQWKRGTFRNFNFQQICLHSVPVYTDKSERETNLPPCSSIWLECPLLQAGSSRNNLFTECIDVTFWDNEYE